MSFFGWWPDYKISKFRGTKELLWKVLRISWKIDRIALPIMVPTIGFLYYFNEWLPGVPKEVENPYIKAYKQKMEEGKYEGSRIGLRPDKYV